VKILKYSKNMDKRKFLRFNLKFGKFIDPILLLGILIIFAISITSVLNLSPKTHLISNLDILGVADSSAPITLKPIYGEHRYIRDENLEKISSSHFRYTTFVNKNMESRISKPIIRMAQSDEDVALIVHLVYTNARNSRISIVETQTNYIIKENGFKYAQKIMPENQVTTLYLVIDTEKTIFFDQYIEIDFFLEKQ
jgi:hypothetical protein